MKQCSSKFVDAESAPPHATAHANAAAVMAVARSAETREDITEHYVPLPRGGPTFTRLFGSGGEWRNRIQRVDSSDALEPFRGQANPVQNGPFGSPADLRLPRPDARATGVP